MRSRALCCLVVVAALASVSAVPNRALAAPQMGCAANGLTPVQGTNWGNGLTGTWAYISGDPLLIAVTGYGQDEDRRRSMDAGFDHHMVKPLDPDALQRVLATRE